MLLVTHPRERDQSAFLQPAQFALHRTGAPPASAISSLVKKLRCGWPNSRPSTRCWVAENSASATLVRAGAGAGLRGRVDGVLVVLIPG